MKYPPVPNYGHLVEQIRLYTQLKHEYGARNISPILSRAEKALASALVQILRLPHDPALATREPNALRAIQRLRPRGPRRLWTTVPADTYRDRLTGALLGRMAGCTLGAPVEFWPIAKMKALARENGDAFPPTDYWRYVPEPASKRYRMSPVRAYTRAAMNGVPVDDDIAYTLLGLLVVEQFGADFTVDDVGRAWMKYLPIACTAERIALDNLKKGVPARQAAARDNPYCEWIGADIRADPWGYMAPGWPERAAAMAYRDACLSHRRQGVYGAMFFAAAVSAAFAVNDPVDALRIGLTEIPRECALAKAVRWALAVAPRIRHYQQARTTMEQHFKGMHEVHTINNACLTIWGICIGGSDFSRVIGETVAMGLDNDCSAATAGSIVGATVGKRGIPRHWYRPFRNTVHSYLIGKRRFAISDLVNRFTEQAARISAD